MLSSSVVNVLYVSSQYHPDMNKSPGAEEKFKEISAAYEVSVLLYHLILYDKLDPIFC